MRRSGHSPHRSLPDAIAHAKASGKGRWGASNPASLERIAMERLNRLTGARAVIVSHEGAIAAKIQGHVVVAAG